MKAVHTASGEAGDEIYAVTLDDGRVLDVIAQIADNGSVSVTAASEPGRHLSAEYDIDRATEAQIIKTVCAQY